MIPGYFSSCNPIRIKPDALWATVIRQFKNNTCSFCNTALDCSTAGFYPEIVCSQCRFKLSFNVMGNNLFANVIESKLFAVSYGNWTCHLDKKHFWFSSRTFYGAATYDYHSYQNITLKQLLNKMALLTRLAKIKTK